MKEFEKKYLDIEYIEMRDKIIRYLLDYNRTYTLYDSKKIRNLLKLLNKYLEKGKND